MSGPAWKPEEISLFLRWTYRLPALQLAVKAGRTMPAVQGMRRKLRRLLVLGAANSELPGLLAVNEALVLTGTIQQIRRRAAESVVPVKPYLRRGRETGRPHLVDEHARRPAEKPE